MTRIVGTIHAEPPQSEAWTEFRTGWPVLLGSILGIAVGVAAIPTPAIGIFLRAMQADFGWSRAEISFGPTILFYTLALVSPFVGWLTDRIRPTWVCTVGLIGLAVSLLLFSRLGPNVRVYYEACAAMAIAAAGAGTTPYARALSTKFVRIRGLALGMAMIGTGLAGIFLPVLLSPYAAAVGWRQGFVLLAAIVAIASVPVGMLMAKAPATTRLDGMIVQGDGMSFRAALSGRTFWTLAASFTLVAVAAGGLHLHLMAFLGDAGVSPAMAGRIAGAGGAAIILGRALAGWLLDRVFAPYVAAAAMTGGAACIVAMAHLGASVAPLGAVAIGLVIGSEIDFIGYMTARYFGLHAYGRIYGLYYMLNLVGAGSSALFYGAVYDATKSYAGALYAAAGLLVLCSMLFATLPRFTRAVRQ